MLLLLLTTFPAFVQTGNSEIVKELNSGWKFRQARLTHWYPATVPGVVHTDLLANKIIEDPFFRLNERGLQWIDKEDWMYETHFDAEEAITNKSNIQLHFLGLDTYADVYLNGESLLNANNMFREWTVNIKGKLKAKDNQLEVYFHSPIKTDIPKFDALPYQYRVGPDQSENGGIFDKRVSIFARKAGYHYGWDWGPRFVTSGIWRPVVLEAWNDLRIENVYIQQKEVTAKKADIATQITVRSDNDQTGVTFTVKDPATGKVYGSVTSDVKKGINTIPVNFVLKNPQLWWCNGLGDPHLYNFETEVALNAQVADTQTTTTGIRSLKTIYQPDKDGIALYVELNGVKVFAKGANYIPQDNFLPRTTDAQYEQTILDAKNVNMNMLRVWGGGTYEKDLFYELCDQHGIMVWQDFMFACSLYPSEGAFLENIKQEAIENITRLRNHPSIALWCGNNEVYYFWTLWNYDEYYRQQNTEYEKIIWKQYCDLFDGVLPEAVKDYSPGTYYHPSSPFNANKDEDHNADRHYWGVWHGQEPTANYNSVKSRFFSEYGFQSFPEFESVKIYAPDPSDWAIESEVMQAHQRAGSYANARIKEYLQKEYKAPEDFEDFLYRSQVLQGDAIKTAIEAHRRAMPYCMGTLFWQHNDCWPVASWSSRDYYGRWKAQHYYSREAYRNILVSPIAEDNDFQVYIVSDRLKETQGILNIQVLRWDGTEVNRITKALKVPANTSTSLYTSTIDALIKNMPANEGFVSVSFTDKGGEIYTNRYFLSLQKDITFPAVKISRNIQAVSGGYEISLQSDQFTRAVFLSIDGIDHFFEDNYFDLLPGKEVIVKVSTALSRKEFEKQLKIRSYNR
ncbi:MAG: Exo-beta-D-glucosaminidase [Candidatus Ordinivivax streblomastigis]|uniref:Beta-mannosidase B n=1 Tax=Candidatus Ordinivivax streblomastigis TaxID=2540710 RepID=A0A5M8P5B9_9BACT|nr:MAG: Exo-beta-D-glucosaminidase [Candidatus Ordinivivax streblomastigis]